MITANQVTLVRLALAVPLAGSLSVLHGLDAEAWPVASRVSLVVFLLAGLLDIVDGALARAWNQATDLGAYLDPLADKVIVFTALIFLATLPETHPAAIPPLFAVLIIAREALTGLCYGIAHALDAGLRIRPHWTGKAALGAVYLVIALALGGWQAWLWWPIAAALVLSSLSLMIYTRIFLIAMLRRFSHPRPNGPMPASTKGKSTQISTAGL